MSSLLIESPESIEALNRAITWQMTEPIRVDRPGSLSHGAIRHGLEGRFNRPMGLYTEITGYAVSLFVFLSRLGRDEQSRNAAVEAADYLVRIQARTGEYPHLSDPEDRKAPRLAYSFDVAACIVGLTRLHEFFPGAGYLESAIAASQWLMKLQRPDGSFFAMMENDDALRDPGSFYGDGSCIHAKNAIALLELHAAIGREELRRAALKVCEYTMTLQADDGAFWCGPRARYVFTHAHAYACEGLLYAGTILGEPRFVDAAHKGVEWLAATQGHDGGWLSSYKAPAISRRRVLNAIQRPRHSDAAAQAARLFSLAGARYDHHRQAAVRFLLQCQDAGGGFHYRRTRLGYSSFLNTWSAQFAVQVLAWNSANAEIGDLF